MGLNLIPTEDIPDEAFDPIHGLVNGGHSLRGRRFDYVLRELGIDDSLYEDHEAEEVQDLYLRLKDIHIPEAYHQPHTQRHYGNYSFHDDSDQQTLIPYDALYLPLLGWLEVLVRFRSGFRADY